jgi:hypothetical protein
MAHDLGCFSGVDYGTRICFLGEGHVGLGAFATELSPSWRGRRARDTPDAAWPGDLGFLLITIVSEDVREPLIENSFITTAQSYYRSHLRCTVN